MRLHRISAVLLGLCLAATGCEHKSKRDDQGVSMGNAASGSAVGAKPAEDLPAEPVGRDPKPVQPAPNPAPAGDAVRAPTAADLEPYTKDIAGTGKLQAAIETSQGTIHCELFPDKAPMTVANFVGLATGKKPWMSPSSGNVERGKPFFDGLTFHRVISGFMIQGGDPEGRGTGGPGYNFQDEFDRSLTMGPGALAMANAGKGPDGGGTNGSQFFIMEGARPDLVGHHTIFGQCKEVDIVKKITAVPKNGEDKPNDPVVIKKVTISKG